MDSFRYCIPPSKWVVSDPQCLKWPAVFWVNSPLFGTRKKSRPRLQSQLTSMPPEERKAGCFSPWKWDGPAWLSDFSGGLKTSSTPLFWWQCFIADAKRLVDLFIFSRTDQWSTLGSCLTFPNGSLFWSSFIAPFVLVAKSHVSSWHRSHGRQCSKNQSRRGFLHQHLQRHAGTLRTVLWSDGGCCRRIMSIP